MSKEEQDKKMSEAISNAAEAKLPENLSDEDLDKVAGGRTDRRSVSIIFHDDSGAEVG